MKKLFFIVLVIAFGLTGCSKCYECKKSTSNSSSTQGACFDKSSDARRFKKDMENNGFDCRVVPEP